MDMDGWLQAHGNVPNAAMRNRIIGAGFQDQDAFVRKKEDDIKRAMSVIRKSPVAANTRDVTMVTEQLLIKLMYFTIIWYKTGRAMDLAQATPANLDDAHDYILTLADDPSDDEVPTFTGKKIVRWFQALDSYISDKKGTSGLPLGYLIRENEAPPAADPGFGNPTITEDLTLRGRHNGFFWRAENKVLFKILELKVFGTEAWALILQFKGTSNGRAAYFALKGQYLGVDVQMVMLKTSEDTLRKITFDGRNRNFPFETFIARLREAFEHMGANNQLSEERKVMKLLEAWNVTALSHVDATVQNDPVLRGNFDNAVNFLANQLSGLKLKNGARNLSVLTTQGDTRRISQLQTDRRPSKKRRNQKKGKNGGKKDDKKPAYKRNPGTKFNKNRPGDYVITRVWNKMTDEEKDAAREARQKEGIETRTISSVQTLEETPKGDSTPPTPPKDAAEAAALAPKPKSKVVIDEGRNEIAKITRTGALVPVQMSTRDPRFSADIFKAPRSIAATQRMATYQGKTKSLLVGKKKTTNKEPQL